MLVRLPVAILSFPLLLQVAATEAGWALGEKSADCDLVCSGEGLICDKDANAAKIIDDLSTQSSYEALITTLGATCSQYADSADAEAPALDQGNCLNRNVPADFTCSAKYTGSQRLCWCTPDTGRWVLGEKSAACEDACSWEGLICDKDANAAKIIDDDLSTRSSYEALIATFSLTCGEGYYPSQDAPAPMVFPMDGASSTCLHRNVPSEFVCAATLDNWQRLCWCTPTAPDTIGAKPKNAKYYAKKAVKYWRRFFAKRVKEDGKAKFMNTQGFFDEGCSVPCQTEAGEKSFLIVVEGYYDDGDCPQKVKSKRVAKILKRRALKPNQFCTAKQPLLCSYCMVVDGEAPILKEMKSSYVTKCNSPEDSPEDLKDKAGGCSQR